MFKKALNYTMLAVGIWEVIRILCCSRDRGCRRWMSGTLGRPGTRCNICNWSSRCATGAAQRRCTCCRRDLRKNPGRREWARRYMCTWLDKWHQNLSFYSGWCRRSKQQQQRFIWVLKRLWSGRGYRWLRRCRKRISWQTGCRSSWGSRQSRPET